MNTKDTTIEQRKDQPNEDLDLYSRYIGKYVICCGRNEGGNAGKVLAIDSTGVILEDARKLYYYRPIDKSVIWCEGVAKTGVSEDSKLSPPIDKAIVEEYSLMVCTDEAEKSIREAKNSE